MLKIKKPSYINTQKFLQVSNYFVNYSSESEENYQFNIVFNLKLKDVVLQNIEWVELEVYNPLLVNLPTDGEKIESYAGKFSADTASRQLKGKSAAEKLAKKAANGLSNAKSSAQKLVTKTYTNKSLLYEDVYDQEERARVNKFIQEVKQGKDAYILEERYILKKDESKSFDSKISLNSNSLVNPAINISNISNLAANKKSELFKKNVLFSNLKKFNVQEHNLKLIFQDLIDPASLLYSESDNIYALVDYYTNDAIDSLPKENLYYGYQHTTSYQNKFRRLILTIDIPKKYANRELDFIFKVYSSNSSLPIEELKRTVNMGSVMAAANNFSGETLSKKGPALVTTNNGTIVAQLYDDFVQDTNKVLSYKTYSISSAGFVYDKIEKTFLGTSYGQQLLDVVYQSGKFFQIYRFFAADKSNSKISERFSGIAVGVPQELDRTTLILEPASLGKTKINIQNAKVDGSQIRIELTDVVTGSKFNAFFGIPSSSNFSCVANTLAGRSYIFKVFYGNVKSFEVGYLATSIVDYPITTTVNNLRVTVDSDGEHDIRFEVQSDFERESSEFSSRSQAELDGIKAILLASGIGQQFLPEISLQKFDFKSIIVHKVFRLNLTTGKREDFGRLGIDTANTTQIAFVDNKESRQRNGIDKYNPSQSYRYEIGISIKDPVTLLRDAVRTITVPSGPMAGKTYSYRPYVWNQPSVIRTGTYYSQTDEGNLVGTDVLNDEGYIGINKAITIPRQNVAYNITGLTARRVDFKNINISWLTPNGVDKNDYDHFVVVKEVNRRREILCTTNSTNVTDRLRTSFGDIQDDQADFGTIIYYVIPVLNDFSIADPSRSNTLTVDPAEFKFVNDF